MKDFFNIGLNFKLYIIIDILYRFNNVFSLFKYELMILLKITLLSEKEIFLLFEIISLILFFLFELNNKLSILAKIEYLILETSSSLIDDKVLLL